MEAATAAVRPLGDPHLLDRAPLVRGALATQQLGAVRPLKVEVHLQPAIEAVAGVGAPALGRVALISVDAEPLRAVGRTRGLALGARGAGLPEPADPVQVRGVARPPLGEERRRAWLAHQRLPAPGLDPKLVDRLNLRRTRRCGGCGRRTGECRQADAERAREDEQAHGQLLHTVSLLGNRTGSTREAAGHRVGSVFDRGRLASGLFAKGKKCHVRATEPAYKRQAATATKAAVSAAPSPARALPAAASAKPASRSELPSGRLRSPVTATATSATDPAALPAIARTRAGKSARWSCASGIDVPLREASSGAASATPAARPV